MMVKLLGVRPAVSEEEASEAVRVYLNLTETLLRYKHANTKI